MAAQSQSNQLRAWTRGLLLALAAVLAAAALSAGALLALLALLDPFGDAPHPSDATMLEQFRRQRPALEELVGMIDNDDELQRLAPDFTRPEPAPVPAARVADYRQRLEAAGIAHGFGHYGDEIEFMVSTRGLAIAGSAKSITYSAQTPRDAVVVEGDLDDAAAKLTDKDVLLARHIDESWWLLLDMR